MGQAIEVHVIEHVGKLKAPAEEVERLEAALISQVFNSISMESSPTKAGMKVENGS